VHALVGENGAGKSTLIKVATRGVPARLGRAALLGRPVSFARPLDAQTGRILTIYPGGQPHPADERGAHLFLNRETTPVRACRRGRMRREATDILRDYGVE